METIFGADNSLTDYAIVILVYFFMFLFIKYPKPFIELSYRGNFKLLAVVWSVAMFTGNYLFFRLGVMSFLPWFNNFIHSFLWVGLCLTWLYYCCNQRPMLEQFLFFSFTSFIIKMTENKLLGTWNMESFLGVKNPYAYLIAMSLVDGFYPVISKFLLKSLAKNGKFGAYIPE